MLLALVSISLLLIWRHRENIRRLAAGTESKLGSKKIGTNMASIQRFHVGPRLSETAVHNGTVYLAGQVPDDTTQDIRGQTAQVLAMVDRLLAEVGSDKSRILMTQIFLADITEIVAMNEVWDAWIPAGNTPPRATVQAAMAKPAYKIEIVVTARGGLSR